MSLETDSSGTRNQAQGNAGGRGNSPVKASPGCGTLAQVNFARRNFTPANDVTRKR